jgi:hypothetical protein
LSDDRQRPRCGEHGPDREQRLRSALRAWAADTRGGLWLLLRETMVIVEGEE